MAIADEIVANTVTGPGPGDPPAGPPKGYVPTNPQQRTDWNGFVDYLGKQGNIDLNNPEVAKNFLNQYKQNNPNFSITPEMLPNIQYENNQFRKGDTFSTLTPDQLKAARTGMAPAFLNQSNPFQQRYPQFKSGSQDFGTDIEGYAKFKAGAAPTQPVNQPVPTSTNAPGAIPLPNYDDQKSRDQYLSKFAPKYGDFVHNRGDTIIHVNEIPDGGTLTMKDSATQAASKVGLDPALLYSSAMEEGASGRFPGKDGKVDTSGDDKYPVDGFHSYGLDNFHDQFKTLVQKGYLPKGFDYQKAVNTNEKGQKVNSGNFKSDEDAMMAKAAYMKMEQDKIDQYAKQKGIQLSDKARQFFTLVNFNGGSTAGPKMLNYYARKGLLKDDKFVNAAPESGLGLGEYYEHIHPRFQMADLLKKENLFQ